MISKLQSDSMSELRITIYTKIHNFEIKQNKKTSLVGNLKLTKLYNNDNKKNVCSKTILQKIKIQM